MRSRPKCVLFFITWACAFLNSRILALSFPQSNASDIDLSYNTTNLTALESFERCVIPAYYPDWTDPNEGFDLIDVDNCLASDVKIYHRYEGIDTIPYKFFSRKFYPGGLSPQGEGFGLPGNIRTVSVGKCIIMVRLARDFGDSTLPIGRLPPSGYYQTNALPAIHKTCWRSILNAVDRLINKCIYDAKDGRKIGLPGWAKVNLPTGADNGEIVVAIWPKGSVIDQKFGFDPDTPPATGTIETY